MPDNPTDRIPPVTQASESDDASIPMVRIDPRQIEELRNPPVKEPESVVLIDSWRKHWTALLVYIARATAVTMLIWIVYGWFRFRPSPPVSTPTTTDRNSISAEFFSELKKNFSEEWGLDSGSGGDSFFDDINFGLALLLLNLAIVAALVAVPWLKWHFTTMEIYTDRFQRSTNIPFIHKDKSDVRFVMVAEASVKQNTLEKFFCIGRIVLSVSKQEESVDAFDNLVKFVPRPESRKDLINSLLPRGRR
jgi:hypothetical protein